MNSKHITMTCLSLAILWVAPAVLASGACCQTQSGCINVDSTDDCPPGEETLWSYMIGCCDEETDQCVATVAVEPRPHRDPSSGVMSSIDGAPLQEIDGIEPADLAEENADSVPSALAVPKVQQAGQSE